MIERLARIGPNTVQVVITRADGTQEWLPPATNLLTTAGLEFIHSGLGGGTASAQGSPLTGVTSTSGTATGTPWTADELIGKRIVAPVTGLTTAPVWGNIVDNSTSVVQIDGWWTSAEGTAGTTPASTNAFIILPGTGSARWIGLSNDSTTPAVGDTSLASEITANGLGRALATYSHTAAARTYTLTKTWTATGTQACQKAAAFSAGYGASGGGVLVAEVLFTAATLDSADTLQITWTFTLPAAG